MGSRLSSSTATATSPSSINPAVGVNSSIGDVVASVSAAGVEVGEEVGEVDDSGTTSPNALSALMAQPLSAKFKNYALKGVSAGQLYLDYLQNTGNLPLMADDPKGKRASDARKVVEAYEAMVRPSEKVVLNAKPRDAVQAAKVINGLTKLLVVRVREALPRGEMPRFGDGKKIDCYIACRGAP